MAAVVRGAWLHSINRPLRAPRLFLEATRFLWTFWRIGSVSALADRRMETCRACAVFDARWETCGNGKLKHASGDYIGCLCFMPVKSKIPGATCWLNSIGVEDLGWRGAGV